MTAATATTGGWRVPPRPGYLTTTQISDRTGIDGARVRQLILEGRLPAERRPIRGGWQGCGWRYEVPEAAVAPLRVDDPGEVDGADLVAAARAHQRRHALTDLEMAARLGLSRPYWSMLRRGLRAPARGARVRLHAWFTGEGADGR